jgi:hypothetical protein
MSACRISIALFLAAAVTAVALEPDELRLGMSEADAISVYTSHRSCANVVLEETPFGLAWEAPLYSGRTRVEISLAGGRVTMVSFTVYLDPDDDGASLFSRLVEEISDERGSPPSTVGTVALWELDGANIEIELRQAPLPVTIRVIKALR